MTLNATDFRRKAQHPLLLALVSVPVMLALVLGKAPEALPQAWALPAGYVLLAWGCILLPGKRRLIGGGVAAAILAVLAAAMLPLTACAPLALLPLMYIALLAEALPIGGWPRQQELHAGWHIAGVGGHLLLQLVISSERRIGTAVYTSAQGTLTVSFLLCAALSLMALNRASLENAAQSRRTVPLLMRRQNLVLTLALLAAGVGIAALPAVSVALGNLWDLALKGVAAVAAWLAALMPEETVSGGGAAASGEMAFSMGEIPQPSQLAIVLEKIFMGLTAVVAVVALALVGRVAVKKLIKLLKYLWNRLGQYSAAAGEDYVDEIISTRDEPNTERAGLLGRLRRYAPVQGERHLSPTERVRARYRQLKRRHADWGRASTARETLPQSPAGIYERARYGGQTLTEAEADSFQQETRRV